MDKNKGLVYVFGNVKSGIDVYDLKKHKIVQMEKLSVFEGLGDGFFQTYAVVFWYYVFGFNYLFFGNFSFDEKIEN